MRTEGKEERRKNGTKERRKKDKKERKNMTMTKEGQRQKGKKGEEEQTANDEPEQELTEEEKMMIAMGIPVGFASTQGTKVLEEDVGAVRKSTKRHARQYMNRKAGFNKPLPAEVSRGTGYGRDETKVDWVKH